MANTGTTTRKPPSPDDALKCLVTVEHNYVYDNQLISENHTITRVEKVLENQIVQSELFGEDE